MSNGPRGLIARLREAGRAAAEAFRGTPSTQAHLEGAGGLAQGAGATAAGAYGTAIRTVQGDVYVGPQPGNSQEALTIYRRVLAQTTGRLPLRGLDVGTADAARAQQALSLARVYVDLDTTANKTQVVQTAEDLPQARREPPSEIFVQTRPMSALEATISHRRLVLLGDPGGGKSTFVNHLAHCLAMHALEPESQWLDHLPEWPQAEAAILPLVVVLRDFARRLSEPLPIPEPSRLWGFIVGRLEAQNLGFAAEPIQAALDRGEVLLLLDGLDEVPSRAQRAFVRDAVGAFVERYPRNRLLVTCRILSYQPPAGNEPDLRLSGLRASELAGFDEGKIDRFIEAWYAELRTHGTVTAAETEARTVQLRQAVRRPDLWSLASNPLLLTVIALVNTHKGRLPDARALLYRDTVEILLWRWEEQKSGGQEDVRGLRALLVEANLGEVDLERSLWRLAYEAHAEGPGGDGQAGAAGIGELKLLKALAALKDNDQGWAQRVIEAIKLRAGLLLERTPGVFAFPHRTFQEYLAGAYLASVGDFARRAARLAGEDAHWREMILTGGGEIHLADYLTGGARWREVILLAVGRLVYVSGDLVQPLTLAAELCPTDGPGDTELGWRKAWLAGEVLNEAGAERVAGYALGRELRERVPARLAQLICGGWLAPRERAAAGDTLAQLGDPRFRTDAWSLPAEPLLGFVEIPAGDFLMGSDPDRDLAARLVEQPQHPVQLPRYLIGRYPVTVAQFAAFVVEGGYEPRDPDCLGGRANHPVAWVTFDDVLNYCGWLGKTLRDWAETPEPLAGLLRGGYRITLPSEAEWERAARGTDGRLYPCGDAPLEARHANYRDTGISGWAPSRTAPRLAAAWTWPAMSGSGRGTYGAGLSRRPLSAIRTRAGTVERTSPPAAIGFACRVAARTPMMCRRCAVPTATGSTLTAGAGASVFVWLCPHRPLDSDALHSGGLIRWYNLSHERGDGDLYPYLRSPAIS